MVASCLSCQGAEPVAPKRLVVPQSLRALAKLQDGSPHICWEAPRGPGWIRRWEGSSHQKWGLPVSRTMRKEMSVSKSPACGILSWRPKQTKMLPQPREEAQGAPEGGFLGRRTLNQDLRDALKTGVPGRAGHAGQGSRGAASDVGGHGLQQELKRTVGDESGQRGSLNAEVIH